jgi:hypothetical protein
MLSGQDRPGAVENRGGGCARINPGLISLNCVRDTLKGRDGV